MKATCPTSIPFPQQCHPILNGLLLGLTLILAACGDNVAGPEMGTDPVEPEPQFTTVYDLDVTTRYIAIGGSCDVDIRGIYANGEFQYRYEVRGEGQRYDRESKNYDSRLGEFFIRQPEETIDFTNKTYSWRTLSSSAEIEVVMAGVEWDGVVRDPRMNNRSHAQTVPFAVGKKTHSAAVGSGRECSISLVYDAEWTERLVQN